METTFHLNVNELDGRFVEALQKLFADQNVVINIATEPDTTEYLLSDPARKARLLHSIAEAEKGNVVAVNLDDYRVE